MYYKNKLKIYLILNLIICFSYVTTFATTTESISFDIDSKEIIVGDDKDLIIKGNNLIGKVNSKSIGSTYVTVASIDTVNSLNGKAAYA